MILFCCEILWKSFQEYLVEQNETLVREIHSLQDYAITR